MWYKIHILYKADYLVAVLQSVEYISEENYSKIISHIIKEQLEGTKVILGELLLAENLCSIDYYNQQDGVDNKFKITFKPGDLLLYSASIYFKHFF